MEPGHVADRQTTMPSKLAAPVIENGICRWHRAADQPAFDRGDDRGGALINAASAAAVRCIGRKRPPSARLCAGELDYFAPFLRLLIDKPSEIGR
jgi:hypothetical protein